MCACLYDACVYTCMYIHAMPLKWNSVHTFVRSIFYFHFLTILFIFWEYNYISHSPFILLPSNTPIYPSLLSFKFMVSFFINCYYIYSCVCACECTCACVCVMFPNKFYVGSSLNWIKVFRYIQQVFKTYWDFILLTYPHFFLLSSSRIPFRISTKQ